MLACLMTVCSVSCSKKEDDGEAVQSYYTEDDAAETKSSDEEDEESKSSDNVVQVNVMEGLCILVDNEATNSQASNYSLSFAEAYGTGRTTEGDAVVWEDVTFDEDVKQIAVKCGYNLGSDKAGTGTEFWVYLNSIEGEPVAKVAVNDSETASSKIIDQVYKTADVGIEAGTYNVIVVSKTEYSGSVSQVNFMYEPVDVEDSEFIEVADAKREAAAKESAEKKKSGKTSSENEQKIKDEISKATAEKEEEKTEAAFVPTDPGSYAIANEDDFLEMMGKLFDSGKYMYNSGSKMLICTEGSNTKLTDPWYIDNMKLSLPLTAAKMESLGFSALTNTDDFVREIPSRTDASVAYFNDFGVFLSLSGFNNTDSAIDYRNINYNSVMLLQSKDASTSFNFFGITENSTPYDIAVKLGNADKIFYGSLIGYIYYGENGERLAIYVKPENGKIEMIIIENNKLPKIVDNPVQPTSEQQTTEAAEATAGTDNTVVCSGKSFSLPITTEQMTALNLALETDVENFKDTVPAGESVELWTVMLPVTNMVRMMIFKAENDSAVEKNYTELSYNTMSIFTKNMDSFNICGVTENTTIDTINEILGDPTAMRTDTASNRIMHMYMVSGGKLQVNFDSATGKPTKLTYAVD